MMQQFLSVVNISYKLGCAQLTVYWRGESEIHPLLDVLPFPKKPSSTQAKNESVVLHVC